MESGYPLLDGNILFVMATDQEFGRELQRRFRPLITGVGPIEAAIGVSLRLQSMVNSGNKPNVVVSLGSAGSKHFEPGTVWQVSSVSWRDMDATPLGIVKGITPFADHPFAIPLVTPIRDVPVATLSTGSNILTRDDYEDLPADLADMETFAIVRACQRFDIPVIGLRGVSDGPNGLGDIGEWTDILTLLDSRLAAAVDLLQAALADVSVTVNRVV